MKNEEYYREKLKEAWNAPYSVVEDRKIEKAWNNFHRQLHLEPKTNHKSYYAQLGMTALFFLILTSYLFLEVNNPVINIGNISQFDRKITLPDGSSVLLKPGSEIEFKKYFRTSRNVNLKGEAFFNIVEDSSMVFQVRTVSTTTKALGTSFSVVEKEGKEKADVFLFTGRVLVSVKNQVESWGMVPGEHFIYDQGKTYIKKFDPELTFESGKRFIDINHLPLKEVFIFLEKQYSYKIENNSFFGNKRVTLRINKDDSLERILKILSIINNTEYEINYGTEEVQILDK